MSMDPRPRLATKLPALSLMLSAMEFSAIIMHKALRQLTCKAGAAFVCRIRGPPEMTPDKSPTVSRDGGA
jgi:hypothetical protein